MALSIPEIFLWTDNLSARSSLTLRVSQQQKQKQYVHSLILSLSQLISLVKNYSQACI